MKRDQMILDDRTPLAQGDDGKLHPVTQQQILAELPEGSYVYFINAQAVDIPAICSEPIGPGWVIPVYCRPGMRVQDEVAAFPIEGEPIIIPE